MDEHVEVTVKHMTGPEGLAWYAWETEYPEEGYFYVSETKPSAEDLKAICENYVEAN